MASRTLHLPRPLLVTDDREILDEVLNLAADLQVDLDVEAEPSTARRRYVEAPFVMVGDSSAAACVRARLPHRSGLVLLTRERQIDHLTRYADALGVDHIVGLPDGICWLTNRFVELADLAVQAGAGQGRIMAVLGGRGGAGASVLAAALAVTAGNVGLRCLLVDADPLGGGVDLVLGWEKLDGLRWSALAETNGAVDPPTLVAALPRRGHVAVLSCDRDNTVGLSVDAMEAALDAGRRSRDLVVADLPRRLDPAAVLALRAADRALLIVPAELRACVAASRVAATVAPHTDVLQLVVRGPAPGRLRTAEIARSLNLPVAGTLRAEPDLPRRLEHGVPPAGSGKGPLAVLCRRLLDDLGLAPRPASIGEAL